MTRTSRHEEQGRGARDRDDLERDDCRPEREVPLGHALADEEHDEIGGHRDRHAGLHRQQERERRGNSETGRRAATGRSQHGRCRVPVHRGLPLAPLFATRPGVDASARRKIRRYGARGETAGHSDRLEAEAGRSVEHGLGDLHQCLILRSGPCDHQRDGLIAGASCLHADHARGACHQQTVLNALRVSRHGPSMRAESPGDKGLSALPAGSSYGSSAVLLEAEVVERHADELAAAHPVSANS